MSGRWPANVILSPSMANAVDEQSGTTRSRRHLSKHAGGVLGNGHTHGAFIAAEDNMGGHDDEGGASRFFLTAGYEPWELEWIIANGLTPVGE